MKKLLSIIFVLALCVPALAATKVGTFGVPNSSSTAPMEVDDARAISVASDATLAVAGTTTLTGNLLLDGSIYSPKATFEGGVILPTAAIDPCPTLGPGAVFVNGTTGAPCFCNLLSVDLSLYNGTTACF